MVVFEEEMCKEVVAKQPVDLEYHGRLSWPQMQLQRS